MIPLFYFAEAEEQAEEPEPAPKPEPALAPFWWEDYSGRKGHRINPEACEAATKALCG